MHNEDALMKTWIPVLLLSATLAGSALPAQAQQSQVAQPASPQLLAQTSDSDAPTSDIPTVAQQLISLLVSGDYAAAGDLYDQDAVVNRDSLRATWEDIVAVNGAYQQQTNFRTVPLEEPGTGTMAIVTVQFASASRDLYIVFNNQNQVVSLDVLDTAER
jgi:hypothetical protein